MGNNLEVLAVLVSLTAALTLVSMVAWISYATSDRLMPRARWEARLVASLVVGAWTANIVFHGLLATGSFRTLPAIGLLGAIAIGVWLGGCSVAEVGAAARRDLRSIGRYLRALRACRGSRVFVVPLTVVLFLGWWSVLIIPMGWDTLTYHAVKAGLWVQDGQSISLAAPGGWAKYRYFFGGGEMLVAWAMLPFHSDLVTGLVDWVSWLGLGLAFWCVSSEIGIPPRLRLPGVAYLMTVPAVYRLVGSGYVEPGLYFFLFAGLFFAVRHRRSGSRADLALGAAALGMACTVKVTAVAYVGMLSLAFIGVELWWPRLRGARAATLVLVGTMFGLAWFPWLSLNYREMGFVFGTTPVEIFGVHLGQLTPEMAWYLDLPDATPYVLRTEANALLETIGSLRSGSSVLGPWSVTLILGGIVGAVRLRRRHLPFALFGGAYVIAAVYAVYQPAFSVVRILFAHTVGRFLMPVVPISVLFLSAALGRRAWVRVALPAYLWYGSALHVTAMFDGMGASVLPWVAAMTMGSLFAIWSLMVMTHERRRWATLAIATVILLVGLPLLDSWKHTQRSKLFAENYSIHDISREWLPTVPYTDTAEPLRIAFSSGPWQEQDQQFLYPFLGARLQHTLMYIPTSRDGRILPHDGTDARPGERSFEHWVARLSEHAITHVMSFGPPTVELGWMEDAPSQFRRLEGDGQNWGFYEFGS